MTAKSNDQTLKLHLDSVTDGRAGGPLTVVIANEDVLETRKLPARGRVVIGRGDTADVQVSDPSLSRHHFSFLIGSTIVVEDLGSSNGTRVRNERIGSQGRVEVQPGDLIEAGTTAFALRRASEGGRRRRIVDHSYFELRVEEEALRASGSRAGFAVLRVSLGESASAAWAEHILTESTRPADVVGRYGPEGEYEVLFLDVALEVAEKLANDLATSFAEHDVSASYGLAVFPRDQTSPEGIIALACERVHGLQPVAGGVSAPLLRGTAMRGVDEMVKRVARGQLSVLLIGETGSGKEVLAEQIHARSRRAEGPLVRVNCAALNEELLASELFGHERGAFTGAVKAKVGLVEAADGGTLFLDEVADTAPSIQAKLLRVLESRTVLPVGSVTPRPVDVRFVSATNRDLHRAVQAGEFREDLYYRLAGLTIVVPPLRERTDEIVPLTRSFAEQACARDGISPVPTFAPETIECLFDYDWPGNIRELRNMVDRAVLLCGAGPVRPEHLLLDKMRGGTAWAVEDESAKLANASTLVHQDSEDEVPTRRPVDRMRRSGPEAERQAVVEALAACDGNQTRAARKLGISRGTLIKRLDSYGIARPRKNAEGS